MSNNIVYVLESRYTILTDDRYQILVDAKRVFTPGPDVSRVGVEALA